MRKYFFIIFYLLAFCSQGQQINIGVYRNYSIQRIAFAHDEGAYSIFADSVQLGTISSNEYINLSKIGNKVQLRLGAVEKGVFDTIQLVAQKINSSITLNPKSPALKQRVYNDNFTIVSSGKGLTVINQVEMGNYLSGVIESEGGGGRHLEYYKVQALMSRTYAIRNWNRHKKEGFSLCDRVHCQAYHHYLKYTPKIRTAVRKTKGNVLVDAENNLAATYFHANCGGQTCEPDYVWNSSVPYLKTFKDTFCIYTRQARWTKNISKSQWRNFLVNEYHYPLHDSLWAEEMYTFKQKQRKAFYVHPSLGIPLRDIRQKFRLKSTFFNCHLEDNYVVLEGRGFGHGVGLCQEGAMNMAKYGYSFKEIARYYFPGLQVKNYLEELFFEQGSSESTKQLE